MIRFSTVVNEMKLFNKTVVELSKEFEKVDKNKYDGMAKEAEKLYNDALPPLT
jgi:hypothetical protein